MSPYVGRPRLLLYSHHGSAPMVESRGLTKCDLFTQRLQVLLDAERTILNNIVILTVPKSPGEMRMFLQYPLVLPVLSVSSVRTCGERSTFTSKDMNLTEEDLGTSRLRRVLGEAV